MKPRLLDLFCGAGGAAMGYARAGFDVVGIDVKPQPRFPFEFHQGDAIRVTRDNGAFGGRFWLDGVALGTFDAVHASPPCQAYSQGTISQRVNGAAYPDLVDATRHLLIATGLPWVIENVPNAPVRADFLLCGSMFGLRLIRHRLFEMWPRPTEIVLAPPCSHARDAVTVTGHGTPSYSRALLAKRGIVREHHVQWSREAMGIDWMNRDELSQSIPPAYTEYVGAALLRALAVSG